MPILYATKVPSAVHQQVPPFYGTWKGTRNLIKSLLEQDPSMKIPVDSNHCLQVHKDPDLRRLVNERFLVKDRESWGSKTNKLTRTVCTVPSLLRH